MNWLRNLFQKQTISQDEQIQIKKQIFRERKQFIDNFIKQYTETEKQKQREYIEKENKIIEIYNSRCPKCKSHDIINKFNKKDTKINVCKSCGHEFRHKPKQDTFSGYYYGKLDIYSDSAMLLFEVVKAIKTLRNFNPNDISEECNTIEEKKIQLTEEIKNSSAYYKHLIDYPIEIILYSAFSTNFTFKTLADFVVDFGEYKNNHIRNYMIKLTPQAHDLMVNYLGFKYHYGDYSNE